MRAEIFSVGTELLLGQIVDTNAPFLADQLALLGIDLYHITQVGDNLERLVAALRLAWSRADLIIMTGGLGPTEDDLGREGIAALLDEPMAVDPELERDLRAYFASRGLRMPDRNAKQAALIPSARPLPNPEGTAPGWFVERDNHIIIAMPGVPHEMLRMWEYEALPRLRPRAGGIIFSRTLRTAGVGESTVEEQLQPFIRNANPTVATYAKRDAVDVRLTAKAPTLNEAQELVAALEREVRAVLGSTVFGVDNDTLQSVIGNMLAERRLTLATMESCTGGLLASTITDVPGSSVYFRGGLVSYSTAMKVQWGVPQAVLDAHGAISEETARAMAEAARQQLAADIGVGVTGVAGPTEQEGKPVGTVHLAVALAGGATTARLQMRLSRTEVKRLAVLGALNLLRLTLLGERQL
jgi:nicotinamide-nucleotide amidase